MINLEKSQILKNELGEIKEHEVMRNHTTWKVGGVADYYYEAKTVDQLIKAIKTAHKHHLNYFVLGNGSNILVSDFGIPGLVIKNSTNNIAFMADKSHVIVDSGVMLSKLIMECASSDFSGLEFLFGIPGTIGGAIYGNAGVKGQSIGDYTKSISILELDDKNEHVVKQYTKEWLKPSYRETELKKLKKPNKPVILTAHLQLAQSKQLDITRKLNEWRQIRETTQPSGNSAGSVFRNPIPEDMIPLIGKSSAYQLPKERTAGYLLDKAGAKKLKLEKIKVSPKHANFIITEEGAKAQDMRQLIQQMKDLVKEKYDIDLVEEIEYVGQW